MGIDDRWRDSEFIVRRSEADMIENRDRGIFYFKRNLDRHSCYGYGACNTCFSSSELLQQTSVIVIEFNMTIFDIKYFRKRTESSQPSQGSPKISGLTERKSQILDFYPTKIANFRLF